MQAFAAQTGSALPAAPAELDLARVRGDFPILERQVNGQRLVYLDNAATSQKPQAVIARLQRYYLHENSNIHRGVHTLSQEATDAYEEARKRAAGFINAASVREVIFTRGTTEAINLVAFTFGRMRLQAGDEVVISTLEHHSNIVPWQMLCAERGARLRVIPIDARGELRYDAYLDLLGERTKLVAVGHVSNALGTINPVRRMIADAHARGIPVLVDGAQAVPHLRVDVQALGCDFYCFSGHKMFGPTGIGILYGREALLEEMPPYQGGGDMIETVTFEGTTYNELPHKFEAGTPNIAGSIGLAEAMRYLDEVGLERIAAYEQDLLAYATERVGALDGVRLVGTAAHKASVLSFVMEDVHPYDAGVILDQLGIAVRTGHHCTQPLMQCLGIPGTIRASFALYNTREDVDALVEGLHEVRAQMHRPSHVHAPAPPTPQAPVEADLAERAAGIAEEFSLFDDLNAKRDYLIELGKTLPEIDEAYRVERYRIHGCQSMVWLHPTFRDDRVYFDADSNAVLTKGLIALLVRLLSGLPPQAILDADVEAFMDRIGMHALISTSRKNGLAAMIKQIKLYALVFAKQAALKAP